MASPRGTETFAVIGAIFLYGAARSVRLTWQPGLGRALGNRANSDAPGRSCSRGAPSRRPDEAGGTDVNRALSEGPFRALRHGRTTSMPSGSARPRAECAFSNYFNVALPDRAILIRSNTLNALSIGKEDVGPAPVSRQTPLIGFLAADEINKAAYRCSGTNLLYPNSHTPRCLAGHAKTTGDSAAGASRDRGALRRCCVIAIPTRSVEARQEGGSTLLAMRNPVSQIHGATGSDRQDYLPLGRFVEFHRR